MKYDESVYIPDVRSREKIARSCGNVKTALNDGSTPQKIDMKKSSPSRSCNKHCY